MSKLTEDMKKTVSEYHNVEQEAVMKQQKFVVAAQRQVAERAEFDQPPKDPHAEEQQWLLAQERQQQQLLDDELALNEAMIQVRIAS